MCRACDKAQITLNITAAFAYGIQGGLPVTCIHSLISHIQHDASEVLSARETSGRLPFFQEHTVHPVNSFQLENPLSGFGLITLSRLVFIKFFSLHLFEHLSIYVPWMQESVSYSMRKSTSPENIPPIFFDREKYSVKRRTNEKSLNPEK